MSESRVVGENEQVVSDAWLNSAGFQNRGIAGWSILLNPSLDGAAIVELTVLCEERYVSVSLTQGMPGEPRYDDDHVTLTSLPPQLTVGHLKELLRILGHDLANGRAGKR